MARNSKEEEEEEENEEERKERLQKEKKRKFNKLENMYEEYRELKLFFKITNKRLYYNKYQFLTPLRNKDDILLNILLFLNEQEVMLLDELKDIFKFNIINFYYKNEFLNILIKKNNNNNNKNNIIINFNKYYNNLEVDFEKLIIKFSNRNYDGECCCICSFVETKNIIEDDNKENQGKR
jgi:hypothetical protein